MFKPRLFLDTSALFAGIWSAKGGARMLLKLGEADAVQLMVSSQVLHEIEEVIRRKAPQFLSTLAILIDCSRIIIVLASPEPLVEQCKVLVSHSGDARILADAWHNATEYLVTLDKVHFLDVTGLSSQLPFPIGTPGDCLTWYRGKLRGLQDIE